MSNVNEPTGQIDEDVARQALRAGARAALASTVLTVLGGALVYALIPLKGDRAWLGGLIGIAAIIVVVPVTGLRVRAIKNSPTPIFDAIEAIVLLVMLLVLGFAAVYVHLSGRTDQIDGIATKIDAVYFSVTTLATVGFGDVHATGQAARGVVTLQMIMDIVLIAVGLKLVTGTAQRRAQQVLGSRGTDRSA